MTSSKQHNIRPPRFTCWHPLLPAFSARIIIAIRTLIGIAAVAGFTLSPVTSQSIQGQLLFGISFIVAIKSTLGATIQTAIRLFFAGAIATIYCLLIINFCPRNVYFAIGATNILVLLIVYTDLPVTVRRFTIIPTCIILLQWFTKSHINTFFVLQIWTSLTIGATLAVIVTCIPLPAIPTAYRELTMRMRFIARQTRREITAIVLLISEYHNTHLNDEYDYRINENKEKTNNSNNNDNDNGIEMPSNSYREDVFYLRSTSLEDLKDDHLLKSDIQDLHSIVNDEVKQMQRALNEISYEPYFILLKLLNPVIVTCIPLPVIPTAYRELTMRMRFIARQTRREITAIALLIAEYHNTHLNDEYDYRINENKEKTNNSNDNDNGIEMPSNSYREDNFYLCSTSLEDLKDDHLLKSDIQDLHSIVNDEVKQMQRALNEISYEPYFILLKLLNRIRKCLRHIPFIKKFIKTNSTLETRLSVWTTSFAAIQRQITELLTLEQHHRAFVGQRQLINVSFFKEICKNEKSLSILLCTQKVSTL
ncbi:unnamed protein product [Rotaria sp. Silwood1]|nr:unnamed protein product [Rotaria sp. Silwood1]